jgi:3-deoxy-7-phosphoheptulonate synthase
MILILKHDATEEQIEHVLARVQELGMKPHLSRGSHRTIVGIIGDEEQLRAEPLRAIAGVADVIPSFPPTSSRVLKRTPKPASSTLAESKLAEATWP